VAEVCAGAGAFRPCRRGNPTPADPLMPVKIRRRMSRSPARRLRTTCRVGADVRDVADARTARKSLTRPFRKGSTRSTAEAAASGPSCLPELQRSPPLAADHLVAFEQLCACWAVMVVGQYLVTWCHTRPPGRSFSRFIHARVLRRRAELARPRRAWPESLRSAQSVAQDHTQKRVVDLQAAVVLDESELPKLVHEEVHARTRRPHHLGERFLRQSRELPMG
jgi:hypothetical protein